MSHVIWYEPGIGFKVHPGIIINDVPIVALEVDETEEVPMLEYFPDLRAICRLLDAGHTA